MSLKNLTAEERELVLRCLRASVEGPFFEDVGFHTLFGLTRAEVAGVAANWSTIDECEEAVGLAINNSMGNLIGYPHEVDAQEAQSWIGADWHEVERVFNKWRTPPE